MQNKKPVASLSLDLDNEWSYLKVHGDSGWDSYPSYLDTVVPRVLQFLRDRAVTISFFVVAQDAALAKNQEALKNISLRGHEICNHSFHHQPWLHLYSESEIEAELSAAEEALSLVTDSRVVGFRGPGFSVSPSVLKVLSKRGYEYDASTLPTYIGPLARTYYFLTAKLDAEEKQRRSALFGKFTNGFLPNKPYTCKVEETSILEIPVTTMPIIRTPIHMSYVLYLATISRALSSAYLKTAISLCRLTRTLPSFLLHPLDFLDGEDCPRLAFFPAMRMHRERKLEMLDDTLRLLSRHYRLVTMREHAHEVRLSGAAPTLVPESLF